MSVATAHLEQEDRQQESLGSYILQVSGRSSACPQTLLGESFELTLVGSGPGHVSAIGGNSLPSDVSVGITADDVLMGLAVNVGMKAGAS